MATYIHKLKDWPEFGERYLDANRSPSKWAALTKSSPDTALRDITGMVKRGILVREAAGGRSTSCPLAVVE